MCVVCCLLLLLSGALFAMTSTEKRTRKLLDTLVRQHSEVGDSMITCGLITTIIKHDGKKIRINPQSDQPVVYISTSEEPQESGGIENHLGTGGLPGSLAVRAAAISISSELKERRESEEVFTDNNIASGPDLDHLNDGDIDMNDDGDCFPMQDYHDQPVLSHVQQLYRLVQAGGIARVDTERIGGDGKALFVMALDEHLELVVTGKLESIPRGTKTFAFVTAVKATNGQLFLACHHCNANNTLIDFLLDEDWMEAIKMSDLSKENLDELSGLRCHHTETLKLWKSEKEIMSCLEFKSTDAVSQV